jgi:hypothetical protein
MKRQKYHVLLRRTLLLLSIELFRKDRLPIDPFSYDCFYNVNLNRTPFYFGSEILLRVFNSSSKLIYWQKMDIYVSIQAVT